MARSMDEAYKRRWRISDFGAAAIEENLKLVQDSRWVAAECLRRVGPTAETTNAIILYGLSVTDRRMDDDEDGYYRVKRLRLLQYKDRLKTYLAVNMGRFFAKEYKVFRATSLEKVAIRFAEAGKTGALGLLLKWHLYSLAPVILRILDAIPETLSPRKYEQILPDKAPSNAVLPRRSRDWVENEDKVFQVSGSSTDEVALSECTEYLVERLRGLCWPTEEQITSWYLERARVIDQLSGQLENSLALLDIGLQKGYEKLRLLLEDATDLHRVSFLTAQAKGDEHLSLSVWEGLGTYDKFKAFLRHVNESDVVDTLMEFAVPFVRKQPDYRKEDFLARFLKELAGAGRFRTCAVVIEQACKDSYKGLLFEDDANVIAAALACIYASPETDQWEAMASVLSKLPWKDVKEQTFEDGPGPRRGFTSAFRYGNRTSEALFPRTAIITRRKDFISDEVERMILRAEAHVHAAQILFQYQVPTRISFFLHQDVNGAKQILRLLLSKFSRRQPSRTEGEWLALWGDLQTLQEKAFEFLDREYMLFEYCRGLLKSGKFTLARSYFESNSSLSSEKVETLVVQIAREYFYSANSLDSYDIERAKECLGLLPSSELANAEADLFVAVTEKLPRLGVYLLPAEFRQIKDPMEVIKMAIYSRKQNYVPVDELLEVARLLGFAGTGNMAVVEEAIAREAAAYGDIELAQELCVGLCRKGHGKIWDLCAALGRGPETETIDVNSRKELLGFALKHCDEESIGELLGAWKDYDLMEQCASLADAAGIPVVRPSEIETFASLLSKGEVDSARVKAGRQALHDVSYQLEEGWERSDKDKKALAFFCLQLPWLLRLHFDPSRPTLASKATSVIMYGLGIHSIGVRDELLLRLARASLDSDDGYLICCGYLAALRDARSAAEFLSEQLETRNGREEQHRLLKVAVMFSSLQEALSSLKGPEERREFILSTTHEQPASVTGIKATSFWSEYKEKAEENLQLLEQTKSLTTLIPNFALDRLFGGDLQYINDTVSPLIRSMQLNKLSSVEEVASMMDELHTLLLKDTEVSNFCLGTVDTAFIQQVIKTSNCEYCEGFTPVSEEESSPLSHLYFLERRYDICKKYFKFISEEELESTSEILFRSSLSLAKAHEHENSGGGLLTYVLKFWLGIMGDLSKFQKANRFGPGLEIVKILLKTIKEGLITDTQGWKLISDISGGFGGLSAITSRKFLKLVILASCSSEAVLKLSSYLSGNGPDSEDLTDMDMTSIYLEVLDDSMQLLEGSGNLESITNVLVSAGFSNAFEADSGDSLRSRLSMYSEQTTLPPEARIRLLELMGTLGSTDEQEGRRRSLVALKSNEVITKEFQGAQITASDLASPNAACSCFSQLVDQASSKNQAVALRNLLEEWGDIFQPPEQAHQKIASEKPEEDDGWGDGWQEFEADRKTVAWSSHELHGCWKMAFLKLLQFQGLEIVLGTLDKCSSSSCTLLTEDETKEVFDMAAAENPVSALKLVLLLPFQKPRASCLALVEDNIKAKATVLDSAIVVLLLSAGLVPSLAGDPHFSNLFSALCRVLGNIAYRSRAGMLLPEDSLGSPSLNVAFPYFIAELTRGRHYGAAGSLVLQHMKTPFFFSTWNASPFALKRYLEAQESKFKQQTASYDSSSLGESSLSYLSESLLRMIDVFPSHLAEALALISRDMQ